MFEVGDVVVCVNADKCPITHAEQGLRKGAIYVIRDSKLVTCARTGNTAPAVKVDRDIDHWRHERCFEYLPKADEQFTAQIRACKPAHRKTPVSA